MSTRVSSQRSRARPVVLAVLATLTVANYIWQIPYAVHQYGSHWLGLPKLSAVLIATLVWFMAGLVRYARGGRAGRALLASFLAVEIIFYVVHNLTGALGRDLPASNPILLIASVLGYVNLVAAAGALVYMLRDRRAGRTSADPAQGQAAALQRLDN
jgi:hypothetical protein